MDQPTMVPSVPLPRNKSRKKSTLPSKRHRSYVWHYFNALGDKVTCRICQHEMKSKQDSSTSHLISHLDRTHGLQRGRIVKNLNSIPTKLVQSSNRVLCMRERVFRSFAESSGGIWRCIQCNYAIEDKKVIPMFHHLRTAHWKASRPIAETIIRKNNSRIAEDGTKRPQIIKTQTLGDGMIPFVDLSAKQCSKVIVKEEPHDDDVIDNNTVIDSSSVKHCSVTLNLLGDNKVEDFNVESKNEPENVERAVSLDHSYRNEKLQNPTPMASEKASSSNQQRVVEEKYGSLKNDTYIPKILTRDDKRKFDHWYSRKSCKEPAASTSRQIKTQKRLPAKKKSCGPRNGSGRIEDGELDSQVDIQVPLQDLPRLNAGVRNTNGKTPTNYEYIKTYKAGNKLNVAVITLSRPKALNALSIKLIDELNDAVVKFDSDEDIGAIIITGSERAFAAGNDIKEMQKLTYARTINQNVLRKWDSISKANKPVIAAVNGYAVTMLAPEKTKPLHRRLRKKGSPALEEDNDASNTDSSFKMLVKNTPHLKVLEISPGCRENEAEYWDVGALNLISGWKNLTVICLYNVPITDGKFLIDIGKECKKLEEITLVNLSQIYNYESELLQMLQHCKNLRRLSILGMSLEHLSEMLNILSNCSRLAALSLETFIEESDPLELTLSVEKMLRQCQELNKFLTNIRSYQTYDVLRLAVERIISELNRPNFQFGEFHYDH